jgi:hypothetical protein
MHRLPLATLILCLLTVGAQAIPSISAMQSPGEQCRAAIVAAERGHGVPPQLLAAIGHVESGRRDPSTGIRGAWPWTINAEGRGAWFETKAEAIAAVQGLQANGVRSIDIGCMQVNLKHHPTAFLNLEQAFEPAVNADYAAQFLVRLYGQTGDWTKAAANYHSANPAEGGPYAAKVTAIWPEEQRKAGLAPTPPPSPGRIGVFAGAVPPFPVRTPPRMYAMAGAQPGASLGMVPPGMASPGMWPGRNIPARMANAGTSPFGIGAPAMMAPAGTQADPAPQPTGVAQTGAGAPGGMNGRFAALPGRGLEFYRAMPIRVWAMTRPTPTMPARLAIR